MWSLLTMREAVILYLHNKKSTKSKKCFLRSLIVLLSIINVVDFISSLPMLLGNVEVFSCLLLIATNAKYV